MNKKIIFALVALVIIASAAVIGVNIKGSFNLSPKSPPPKANPLLTYSNLPLAIQSLAYPKFLTPNIKGVKSLQLTYTNRPDAVFFKAQYTKKPPFTPPGGFNESQFFTFDILPQGEYDTGLPFGDSVKTSITLDGFSATKETWTSLPNDTVVTLIKLTGKIFVPSNGPPSGVIPGKFPPQWTKENRIMYAVHSQYQKIADNMISSLKFSSFTPLNPGGFSKP